MKILLIGDLHTKSTLLPFLDRAVKQVEPDHIILMGDYMDDWGISGADVLKATKEIITWVRQQKKATMLMGNHDMAYFSKSGKCSGNNRSIMTEAHELLKRHLDIIRVAVAEGSWLFTHAGLCSVWAKSAIDKQHTAKEAAESLNMLLDTDKGQMKLEAVGRRRGGFDDPGPLWADWSELLADYLPTIHQVVGHSPRMTCTHTTTATGEQLWCCDTFSAGSRGFPHGDGSMLLLDTKTGEARVIEQPDPTGFDIAYAKHYNLTH